jgi:uncharacterized protein (TIGR03435 family)
VQSERYDLQATASAPTTSDTLRLMLRTLLAERLGLQGHPSRPRAFVTATGTTRV